ncbi:MAG: hypothetical protein SNJ70_06120 [Armatimonadota bacterium]
MKLKSIYRLSCIFILLISLIIITGCNNKNQQTQSPNLPPTQNMTDSENNNDVNNQTNESSFDPNKKIEFSDLSLSSEVTVINRSGVRYLQFEYEDSDGKIYKTIVPEAMTQGAYTPSEWKSTFRVYRAKDEAPRQAPKQKKTDDLNDFPFIAPKGSGEEKTEPQRQQPTRRPVSAPSSRPSRSIVPYQGDDGE